MANLRQRIGSAIKRNQANVQGVPVHSVDPGQFAAPHPAPLLGESAPADVVAATEERKQRYLSEIEIFCDLSPREIEHLAKTTTMFTTEKGKVFYFPEEAGEVVFLLKKGKVQLYRLSPEGRKLVIATLEQGGIFGEMSLLGQGMYNTFAEAMEDCLICIMSRQEMVQLLVEKPQVALRILDVMGRRLQRAETQLEEVAFKKVPERLALALLRLAGVPPGEERGDSSKVPVVSGLTHQDLAEMIATHRETVSFALNDFKARGLVDLAPKSITILDVESLRALCS
jgi:CRP/FNR family cyclic AMP-dependent transcriptional regulator